MDAEDLETDFVLSGNDSIIDTSLSSSDSSTSRQYTRRNETNTIWCQVAVFEDTSDDIKGNFITCIAFKIWHLHFYHFYVNANVYNSCIQHGLFVDFSPSPTTVMYTSVKVTNNANSYTKLNCVTNVRATRFGCNIIF